MPRWPSFRAIQKHSWLQSCGNRRPWSSHSHVKHVRVPCASAGSISVSLYNVALHDPETPLVICIPPFAPSHGDNLDHFMPSSLRSHPTAIINYRWPGSSPNAGTLPISQLVENQEDPEGPAHHPWPNPIHDVLFGYSWITRNLSPANFERRDVYIFGSYLGASLGAALALTESHYHRPLAVRGLVTYNGIFNWTGFLPDHPIQKARRRRLSRLAGTDTPQGSSNLDVDDGTAGTMFHYLKQQIPLLFRSPANLFDPFASPSLLLHSPGLWVPSDFHVEQLVPPELERVLKSGSAASAYATPEEAEAALQQMMAALESARDVHRPPRKGHLKFPPRGSDLRIPHTLLLHETAPAFPGLAATGRRRKRTAAESARESAREVAARQAVRLGRKQPTGEHGFGVQAEELAALLRRSLDRMGIEEEEADRRVRVADVGKVGRGAGLNDQAQDLVAEWFEERLAR